MSQTVPMSFDEYESSLAAYSENKSITEFVGAKDDGDLALSPFASGKDAMISAQTRKETLNYAHPVDSSIVKKLDNPSVNAILSKIVQTSIDMNYGVTLATGIHITPSTVPDMYRIVEECANELKIAIPYVVISNSMRGLNACTCGTNQFAFIMISSLLPMVMSREEICFVIGHEFGHLAMGHALYHTAGQLVGTAGSFIPVIGKAISGAITYPLNAWSRRSEITADRSGLICCKDLEIAKKALFRLEVGLYSANGVNIDQYVDESEAMLSNSHLGKLSEYSHSHPLIPKRIRALEMFANSEVYADAIGEPRKPGMISREMLNTGTERIIKVMDNPIS